MNLSNNISGYKIQTINLSAGIPQQITGPGRGFEVLQPGEGGTRTSIQAERETSGQFSDNSEVMAFDATPGLRVVNYDKIVFTSPVDSQMKVKIYTGKTIATVETGPTLSGQRVLWSTNAAQLNLAQASLDPYELSGPDARPAQAYNSRGDGLRELKYSDRCGITTGETDINQAFSFSQVKNTEFGYWGGWISNDSDFSLEVYGAPYNSGSPATTVAFQWTLIQTFSATKFTSSGTVPSTDGSQTFADQEFVINFDAKDNTDFAIPAGSLRVYLTAWTGTSTFLGLLTARTNK